MPGLLSQLDAWLGTFALGAARTVPLAWTVPVFGGPMLPIHLRLGVGLGLACLVWPMLVSSAPTVQGIAWVLLAAREMLVGIVMAFVCACVFRAAEAAGGLADGLRGANPATTAPAADGPAATPLGVLLLLFACAIFFEIGGAGHVAAALARSYEAIPLGAGLDISSRTRGAAWVAIAASAKLIEAAVGLAAPVMLAALLADVVLGTVARAVPGIGIAGLGAPIKALLGLGAVLLALAAVDVTVQGKVGEFFGLLDRGLRRWF